jgi:hypothetical protein
VPAALRNHVLWGGIGLALTLEVVALVIGLSGRGQPGAALGLVISVLVLLAAFSVVALVAAVRLGFGFG